MPYFGCATVAPARTPPLPFFGAAVDIEGAEGGFGAINLGAPALNGIAPDGRDPGTGGRSVVGAEGCTGGIGNSAPCVAACLTAAGGTPVGGLKLTLPEPGPATRFPVEAEEEVTCGLRGGIGIGGPPELGPDGRIAGVCIPRSLKNCEM